MTPAIVLRSSRVSPDVTGKLMYIYAVELRCFNTRIRGAFGGGVS